MSVLGLLLSMGADGGSSGIVLQAGYPSSVGGGTRSAAYRIDSDGYIYHGDNGVYTTQYQWKQNTNAASDFEARVDVTVGSVSGTTGSWLGLGTDREWSVTDATADGDGNIATCTVQIRNASTLVVLASETVEFIADRWS